MVVLWSALLGLGLLMSGAAIGLTLRDRRRGQPHDDRLRTGDEPGPADGPGHPGRP